MICPKCHYDWRIEIIRCRCGCYFDHGLKENDWLKTEWIKEHRDFIANLPQEKISDWFVNSGNKKAQDDEIKELKQRTEIYLNTSREIFENQYKSFVTNKFLIKRIIQEAIGNDAEIFASYGKIKCTEEDDECKSILVINDPKGHGTGEVIEIANDNFELLKKLIAKKSS